MSSDEISTRRPEKLRDYERNPSYETRVVAFYDILGWRSEIDQAADDQERLGKLRRVLLQHSRLLRLPVKVPVAVSTFSDNIVVSTPPSRYATPYFLRELATLQLMTMGMGFLLRGGVTVGKIVHDDEVVFGPALNRAYELESSVAIYPRIVLDQTVLQIGKIAGFHATEDGVSFLDPFTTEFFRLWFERTADRGISQSFLERGIPSSGKSFNDKSGNEALIWMLALLKTRLKQPLLDKDWSKLAWLYNRIAARLGVPPASSYPRVLP